MHDERSTSDEVDQAAMDAADAQAEADIKAFRQRVKFLRDKPRIARNSDDLIRDDRDKD